ncbi:MAG: MFS transporter [Candidatus Caldarchaeum sp.]
MNNLVLAWAASFLCWVYVYSLRVAYSPALPNVISELQLSHSEAGLSFASYFYTYASLQFIAGFFGELFGRKRVIVAGMLISSLGGMLTSISHSLTSLVGTRLLTGLGHGLIFSNDRSLIASLTPKDKLGLVQGLSFSGFGVGLMVGTAGAGALIPFIGWRQVLQLISVIGVIFSFFIILTVTESSERNDEPRVKLYGLLRDRNYMLMVFGGIPIQYTFWVFQTWLPTALLESNMADLTSAALVTSLVGVGTPIGLVTLGKLSDVADKRGGERTVLFISSLLMTGLVGLLTLLYMWRAWLTVIAAVVLASGFFHGMSAPMLRFISRNVGNGSPIAFGLLNGFHFIGSAVSPYITGLMRDVSGRFEPGLASGSLMMLISAAMFRALSKR